VLPLHDFSVVKATVPYIIPDRELTEKKKRLIIDWKKWVFTVHLVAACSFLFLLPEIGKNNPKAEQIQTDNEIRMNMCKIMYVMGAIIEMKKIL
jgi:hypothetical protein